MWCGTATLAVVAVAFAAAEPARSGEPQAEVPEPDPGARPLPPYAPALPAAGVDSVDDPSVVVIGDYKLRRTGSGEYLYEDSRFKVRVGTDGTARFEDKKVDARSGIQRMLDPKELTAWRNRDARQRISPRRLLRLGWGCGRGRRRRLPDRRTGRRRGIHRRSLVFRGRAR